MHRFPIPVKKTLTVDELTSHIEGVFGNDPLLGFLRISGEILEIKRHTSGHVYFALAGDRSRLSCVMFRSDASKVPSWPKKGDDVVLEGAIRVYGARGVYQLYATRIFPVGEGAQARARRELQARLQKEGLFDPGFKRRMPSFPERVVIITSPSGAAVKDVVRVARHRYPSCRLIVSPCLVQGVDAPGSIVSSFRLAAEIPTVDAIMLVRGGGSRDDLYPFDTEEVVRAVRMSAAPVITGLGHEIDRTLSDLAADASGSTPSSAAERLFPDRGELLSSIRLMGGGMAASVRSRVDTALAQTGYVAESVLNLLEARYLQPARNSLDSASAQLRTGAFRACERGLARLDGMEGFLNRLSPLSIMNRGYVLPLDENRAIPGGVRFLKQGQKLTLQFVDGDAFTVIEKTQSNIRDNEKGEGS